MDICPGVTEVRPVTSRIYGIRVRRQLISKLVKLPGLHHANPRSDLFCVEVGGMDVSAEAALKKFREIVGGAGLGSFFGVPAAGKDAMR